MNRLVVGFDKSPLLEELPPRFLFIDDGPLIDRLELSGRRAVTVLDLERHSFNPLKDMDYPRARDFVAVLDAVFPEGESTLTRRYSSYILLSALLTGKRKRLDALIAPSKENQDAYQKVQTLLLSPVLERVLNRPSNVSLKGTVIARLDRAAIGDFDAFVLGTLLMSMYRGPVLVPDFGFYGRPFHTSLIRQGRLHAGINSFDELPKLRNELVLIEQKIASRCTPDDAELLALYAGVTPGTNAFNEFVARAISSHHPRERA